MSITTHVLDTSRGRPAEGVPVVLEFQEDGGKWKELARGRTNIDGRIPGLLPDRHKLEPGMYSITFDTTDYFQKHAIQPFYPFVTVTFQLHRPDPHYHIPLLLSPFGYSTYRGS